MTDVAESGPLEDGWVSEPLASEFPELRVLSCALPAPDARADPGVVERLEYLASRFNGRRAVELRREPVPAAYRVFHRHIGLDPDVDRTPIEAAAVERLLDGGHRSQGRVPDALLLALLETGVAITALDAAAVDGPVGLRESRPGERLGSGELAPQMPAGRIVIADAERTLGELFGRLHEDVLPGKRTKRLVLVCVQVPGVPSIHVEEAVWTCIEALAPSA